MDILKVLIPIITFILGSLFTLFLKEREKKTDTIQKAANEIANLTSDWYEQLHQINVKLRFSPVRNEIEQELYLYLHNRLILPKYLRALKVLEAKKCNYLVRYAHDFLDLVTDKELIDAVFTLDENDSPFRLSCSIWWVEEEAQKKVDDLLVRWKNFSSNHHHKVKKIKGYNPTVYDDFTHTPLISKSFEEPLSIQDSIKIRGFERLLLIADKINQEINKEAAKLM